MIGEAKRGIFSLSRGVRKASHWFDGPLFPKKALHYTL